jgi:hypothetical protein
VSKSARPNVASFEAWQAARDNLLAKEKELTRALDALAAEHANPSTPDVTLARSEGGRIVLTPRNVPNAWPEHWGLEDRDGFLRSAGATMRRFGYAPEPATLARR